MYGDPNPGELRRFFGMVVGFRKPNTIAEKSHQLADPLIHHGHTNGELGSERAPFIDGRQREWDELPDPGPPLTVGLDGGYVHAKTQRSRHEGWFEVIVGKSVVDDGNGKCFAYVQTYDHKPKRRLFEFLKSHGVQENHTVRFLTDGGEDVRAVPEFLSAESEHLLDWFHLTMRLTAMRQLAKRLPRERADTPTQTEEEESEHLDSRSRRTTRSARANRSVVDWNV